MTQDLIKFSRSIKRDAEALLKKTALIKKLSKYGEAIITGSYRLDLMMDGDIDIFIVDRKINKKRSLTILNELILLDDFKGYLYYDWSRRSHTGFPKGFYIGLKTDFKGRKWKIDLWLLKSKSRKTERFMDLIDKGIDKKSKVAILELKRQAKEGKIDLSSSDIYRKVLNIR